MAFLLYPRADRANPSGDGAPARAGAPRGGDQDPGSREVGDAGAVDQSFEEPAAADLDGRLPNLADDEMRPAEAELARDADARKPPAFDEGAAELDDDDQPLDPEFAPEPAAPRKIDLALSLKQPIVRFDQPRSKPLEEVLTSVAEMAGARITFDREELGPAAARLSEPMALKLDDTTVGEILTGLLRPVGLAYRIEGDHLRVIRAE
jgi:hypothetical protein